MASIQEKRRKAAKLPGLAAEQLPRHIAIIMDGNGRWARLRGLPRFEGHRQGARTVEKIVKYCVDLGIECLTLYSFSMQNWKRPRQEVSFLMELYVRYLIGMQALLMRNDVRLLHLGRVSGLSARLKKALIETTQMTAGNKGMVLALALNYGSRTEIADAARKIAQEYKQGKVRLGAINEKLLNDHLYTAGLPEPDLLIRTSNEMRVSNFLLWQISYSEFFVTSRLWPDFGRADLRRAILAYAQRRRRYGGI